MNKLKTGIYVHIPFCQSKCFYCDFITFVNKEQDFETYKNAVINEIKSCHTLKQVEIETIFIGGGTPTILPINYLCEIIDELLKYKTSSNIEITVESNPGTLSKEYLKQLYQTGVNRLSMGLQAYDDIHLKNIGRIHTVNDFLDNYNSAISVGFTNINIDLMFALPNLTMDSWQNTIENIVFLNPAHISAYSLIIEEGTRFGNLYQKGLFNETDEALDRDMYDYANDFLKNNNYIRYEISNFSKQNMECKHNIDCWNRKNYLGFGINAHSLFNGIRYSNTKNFNKYVNGSNKLNLIRENIDIITPKEAMEEFMFLGLRLTKGICISEFKEQFGVSIFDIYEEQITKLQKQKLLQIDKNNNISITKEGFNIANKIFLEFL